MKKIDEYYIMAGLVWLVAGMAYGIWVGISEQSEFADSHAHMTLVGFVVSTLFGMTYRFFPAMKGARLAAVQFWIYEAGAVLFVAGKIVVDAKGPNGLVAFGSVVIVVGAALMLWIFAMNRTPAKAG